VGEHPVKRCFVDEPVWRRVQCLLKKNGGRNGVKRNKYGALLRGILYCTPCDSLMVHTSTKKDSRRYRYYTCSKAHKQGWDACPSKSIPANEIERFVVKQIRCMGKDPVLVAKTVEQVRMQHSNHIDSLEQEKRISEKEIRLMHDEIRNVLNRKIENSLIAELLADLQDRIRKAEERLAWVKNEISTAHGEELLEEEIAAALSAFDPVWESLSTREQSRIIHLLVERVGYDGKNEKITITFRPTGIKSLARDSGYNNGEHENGR